MTCEPRVRSGLRPVLQRTTAAVAAGIALAQIFAGAVLGASATAGAGGDTRSAGQGPGFVGAPAVAILAILLIGVASAALTAAYVRLSSDRAQRGGGHDLGDHTRTRNRPG